MNIFIQQCPSTVAYVAVRLASFQAAWRIAAIKIEIK
jgi:hypothetical protein